MLLVKIFAVINQKGGVGKTTTVANLGAAVASQGKDVCLIDLDPQAHLTLHFGLEPGQSENSIYEVLTSDASLADAAVQVAPKLSIVPSIIDLAAAEVEIAGTVGREQILRDKFAAETLPYEYVFIDCPPSLGLLTLNALSAANEILIPLQPHFLALQGLGKLLETIALVQRRINRGLRVRGIILCMYETGTKLAGEVAADLQNFFREAKDADIPWASARIFAAQIRRNIKLAECPSHGITIFDYAPGSHGAEDYNLLAEEFLAAERARPPAKASADTPAAGNPPPDNPPGQSNQPVEQ